jgi:hypothetical protein
VAVYLSQQQLTAIFEIGKDDVSENGSSVVPLSTGVQIVKSAQAGAPIYHSVPSAATGSIQQHRHERPSLEQPS